MLQEGGEPDVGPHCAHLCLAGQNCLMLLKPVTFTKWLFNGNLAPWETEIQGGKHVPKIEIRDSFSMPLVLNFLSCSVDWSKESRMSAPLPKKESHTHGRHQHLPHGQCWLDLCPWPLLAFWGDLQSDFPAVCHSSGYCYRYLLSSFSRYMGCNE